MARSHDTIVAKDKKLSRHNKMLWPPFSPSQSRLEQDSAATVKQEDGRVSVDTLRKKEGRADRTKASRVAQSSAGDRKLKTWSEAENLALWHYMLDHSDQKVNWNEATAAVNQESSTTRSKSAVQQHWKEIKSKVALMLAPSPAGQSLRSSSSSPRKRMQAKRYTSDDEDDDEREQGCFSP